MGTGIECQEKSLRCSACGVRFTLSIREQERFADRGLTGEPIRCSWCRAIRKIKLNENGDRSSNYSFKPRRQMFPATCTRCGKATQVPFQPRGGKPVYCSDCYNKARART